MRHADHLEIAAGGPFAIGIATDDEYSVYLTPRGELDMPAATQLRALLDKFLGPGRAVTVDFRELSFIDSAGIQVVLHALRQSAGNGSTLILRKGNTDIMRTFEVAGLLNYLTFKD